VSNKIFLTISCPEKLLLFSIPFADKNVTLDESSSDAALFPGSEQSQPHPPLTPSSSAVDLAMMVTPKGTPATDKTRTRLRNLRLSSSGVGGFSYEIEFDRSVKISCSSKKLEAEVKALRERNQTLEAEVDRLQREVNELRASGKKAFVFKSSSNKQL
jgi:hypothetical protein